MQFAKAFHRLHELVREHPEPVRAPPWRTGCRAGCSRAARKALAGRRCTRGDSAAAGAGRRSFEKAPLLERLEGFHAGIEAWRFAASSALALDDAQVGEDAFGGD